MKEKLEFEKEYTKQEIDIQVLKNQVEMLTLRINHLEKYYTQWLQLKKYYKLEDQSHFVRLEETQ